MDEALEYARSHADAFLEDLEHLLRIPSISTDSRHRDQVREAANFLRSELEELGFSDARLLETDGHPVVLARRIDDPDAPTVLCYGHYDVQPPDPEDLWESPPFEPTRKNGQIYARGACDDKGQLMMNVKAAESYLRSEGRLPVNLIFLIEGEEEVGSAHLPAAIEEHAEKLDADVALISDTSMFAEETPSITYSLRGMAYMELELTGPDRDLHSGLYGGAVENPAHVLARLIASFHDEDHRVDIPGFYDEVRPLTGEERATYAELPFDANAWKDSIGVEEVRTERGYSILEATTARPTLDVNGLWGGYQGEGAKTVLPAKAGAKISMRLVPDQDPDRIADLFRSYVEDWLPATVTADVTAHHGGHPVMIDPDQPALQSAADAMEAVLDRRPFFTRAGGTIPVVAEFKQKLGLDTVLLGFGLHSDSIHSPNEHFGIDRYHKGTEASIRFMDGYRRAVGQ